MFYSKTLDKLIEGLKEWLSYSEFSDWRWVRRFCSRHWEKWYVGSPVNQYVWHRVERCYHEQKLNPLQPTGNWVRDTWLDVLQGRPSTLCSGEPICEDWSRQRIQLERLLRRRSPSRKALKGQRK